MTGVASIRRQLLWWLIPGTLLIFFASIASAWWIAHDAASDAHDRGLVEAAKEVAEQLLLQSPAVLKELPPSAQRALLASPFDQVFFRIDSETRGNLAGTTSLPLPPTLSTAVPPLLFDITIPPHILRAAALRTTIDGEGLLVMIASTSRQRDRLINEILIGLIVPEFLLILATLALVWVGISAGLRPLAGLRTELARRSADDLRPVTTAAPEELQPVVAEINSLLERLEKSLASQRHFVSDAAHQLRTPIAALQAQVEATLRETDRETAARLQRVLSPALRLSHLVDQLLALARAEPSGKVAQEFLSLPTLVHNVAEHWLPKAIAKNIDLGFELEPANIRGNRLLLAEVLANLIDNALRHTPPGGTVNVSCRQEDDRAVFSVEDSGPGIPEEERDKVFARFYQSPGHAGEGCGLGLAIVKEFTHQHGGVVVIDTAPTLGGARIRVSLPVADAGPD